MEKLTDLVTGIIDILWNVTVVAVDTLLGFFTLLETVPLPAFLVAALASALAIRVVMNFF